MKLLRPTLTEENAARWALLFGATVAICVFGPGFIFGTSDWWTYPPRDFNSHVIGYRMYLLDAWRFPLFYTATMDEPRGLNLLYMDALPIVALPMKALAPIVPSFLKTLWFNPLGFWHVVTYAFQAYFGARLVKELHAPSIAAQLSGAVIAVAMPIFVFRFIHTAHSSHFLLLWAILLYLRTVRGLPWKKAALAWTALFSVTSLIHPYLFAMCAGIFAPALATWMLQRRIRDALLVGAIPVAAVIAIVLLGGFLGEETTKGGLWGYGYKTTDLSSFVVPQWGTFFPFPKHPLKIDMAHTESAEGYAYLGLGLIVLSIVMIAREPRLIGRAIKNHKLLFIAVLLMAWFAISHRVSFAQKILFETPLPSFMDWPVRQFRSCGRFIWPAIYVASFYLVALSFRTLTTRRLRFLPPFLAAIQFVDCIAAWIYVSSYTAQPEAMYLEWDIVRPVVYQHRGVTFGPAIDCIDWRHPIVFLRHMEIEYLAAQRGVGLSNMKGSRPLIDCNHDNATRARQPISEDRLYLLFPPEVPLGEALHYERRGVTCMKYRQMIGCSTKFDPAAPPPGFTPFTAPVDYTLGEVIRFGKNPEKEEEENDKKWLGVGWSWGENGYRWTQGESAFVYFRLSEGLAPGTRVRLKANGAIFAARPVVKAEIVLNGTSVGFVDFGAAPQMVEQLIPDALSGQRLLELEIRPADFRAPSLLDPKSTDERQLAVAVTELTIVPPP